MRHGFFTKLAVCAIVLMAFVDGWLMARHFYEDAPESIALEAHSLENLLEQRTIEEEEPVQNLELPFTVQAPLGWESPWTDFAEEAAVYMTIKWLRDEPITRVAQTAEDLLALAEWEVDRWGSAGDASLEQVRELFTEYYGHEFVRLSTDISDASLRAELEAGHVVLLPVNGQTLDSPYYSDPAPEHHMLVLIGYDAQQSAFIVNDPGTTRGEALRYSDQKILASIQDLDGVQRVLIVAP